MQFIQPDAIIKLSNLLNASWQTKKPKKVRKLYQVTELLATVLLPRLERNHFLLIK